LCPCLALPLGRLVFACLALPSLVLSCIVLSYLVLGLSCLAFFVPSSCRRRCVSCRVVSCSLSCSDRAMASRTFSYLMNQREREREKRKEDDREKELERQRQIERFHEALSVKSFTIGRKLGKGEFSDVYFATHNRTGHSYALKCIDKANLSSRVFEGLRQEIVFLGKCAHPHIIQLHGYFEQVGHLMPMLPLEESSLCLLSSLAFCLLSCLLSCCVSCLCLLSRVHVSLFCPLSFIHAYLFVPLERTRKSTL
jgi:hypothetical protein